MKDVSDLLHPPTLAETQAFISYWRHRCHAAFALGLTLGFGGAGLLLLLVTGRPS
jgi:hypothetical protein